MPQRIRFEVGNSRLGIVFSAGAFVLLSIKVPGGRANFFVLVLD
jgi:hypothetical protein